MNSVEWSIVVPVFNEQESLPELLSRIGTVAQEHGKSYEVCLVDDGSSDDSWQVIEQLAAECSEVRGIRFRRNFGKAAALSAAFEAVQGRVVFTMDADLQDDPAELPNLLAKMDEGFDVVSGWKQVRHDPWHKVLPSRLFNWLVSWLTGVKLHDHNCGLKAYRGEVVKQVQLYGERHRFIPVLAAAQGYTVSEIPVQHQARKHGASKYGFERFIKGFLDLLTVYFLTGYGTRPQHLLGSIGLISFSTSMFGLTLLTIGWAATRLMGIEPPLELHKRAIFYYCILGTLFGAQLITIGFIAELITAHSLQSRKPYSVAECTDKETQLES